MTKQNETQRAAMFFVRALTPVHIGVDTGLGAIKLPTMREAITLHPVIPGSSFKGVLRDLADANNSASESIRAAFGPDRPNASDSRGGLVLSDARLLLLPIASLKGTFAWATSKTVLQRFNQDLSDAKFEKLQIVEPVNNEVLVTETSKLVLPGNRVSLREVFASAKPDPVVTALARRIGAFLWTNPSDQAFFAERFAIVPEDAFNAFSRSALEIRARVAIDSERGTAESSGPWTEEHIPAETILAGLVFGRKTSWLNDKTRNSFEAHQMLEVFKTQVGTGAGIRVGGHSGIGLGRVFLTCAEAK